MDFVSPLYLDSAPNPALKSINEYLHIYCLWLVFYEYITFGGLSLGDRVLDIQEGQPNRFTILYPYIVRIREKHLLLYSQ